MQNSLKVYYSIYLPFFSITTQFAKNLQIQNSTVDNIYYAYDSANKVQLEELLTKVKV